MLGGSAPLSSASSSNTASKQFFAVLVNGQNVTGSPLAVLVSGGAEVCVRCPGAILASCPFSQPP